MRIDPVEYNSPAERARMADVVRLLPTGQRTALDVGARDGYVSMLLTSYYDRVTALDLTQPAISHGRVACVEGDVTDLQYADGSFDTVVCLEVLEHIPPPRLAEACSELVRVARQHIIVGVPYRQDLRVGRSTCYSCGAANPPWGHVNSFDETKLADLFTEAPIEEVSFVGSDGAVTNPLATWLMDFAGNPYGTYRQEEPCTVCGARLQPPPRRRFAQKVSTRLAFWLTHIQGAFVRSHPAWMHARLRKLLRPTPVEQ